MNKAALLYKIYRSSLTATFVSFENTFTARIALVPNNSNAALERGKSHRLPEPSYPTMWLVA
jgi:hypothetical protein